jgi:hypothetical protein
MAMIVDVVREARWFGQERAVGYAKMMAIAFALPLVWFYLQAMGPLGSDFMGLWSAGKLALAGHPADAYRPAAERAFQLQFGRDRWVAFLCSPPFLFLIAPFALLPYSLAWPAWVASTYVGWLTVARRLAPGGFWPIAVFPGAMVSAWHGQNGFVTGGLFVAASLALRNRPWLAGVLFGALIVKPHLAVLVPVALAAGREWKAFAGAAASACGLLLLSALAFGPETFRPFLESAGLGQSALSSHDPHLLLRMPTVYAAAAVHLSPGPAAVLQALSTAAMIGMVWWAWSRPIDPLAKCAVLASGAVLATPYLFHYDLVLLIVPVCWLAREGLANGFRPWERSFLAAFYWAPFLTRAFNEVLGVNLMPAAVLTFIALAVSRIVAAPAAASPATAVVA